MLTYLQYHKEEKELEFMTSFGKIKTATIEEVSITINKYHKHIVYELKDEEEKRYFVDGETFREI